MAINVCVVLITASGKPEARRISKGLLRERLAACVNIVPVVESAYWWKGKLERAAEALLIVKTRRALLPRLKKKVCSLHSYTVPEIIALPIRAGHQPYLTWISRETRKK